jgi:hypothetical protein
LLERSGVEHGFGVRGAIDPPDVRRPRQVHGTRVVTAEQCAAGEPAQADAVLCLEPGVAVGIVTADCLPILAASADGRAVVAIHAGWRGLAQGVIEAGITALARAGASGILAAVGPHVGACCYEVDAPVLTALSGRYGDALEAAIRPGRVGHAWLDLGLLAREALTRSGVAAEAIGLLTNACTSCDRRRFHSYRRDGARSGRLLHFVRTAKIET